MDSQHLFGARGDTDSCLLLWAVHVSRVRRGSVVGLVERSPKSRTFWESASLSSWGRVTSQRVGELLYNHVYHKQMWADEPPGGVGWVGPRARRRKFDTPAEPRTREDEITPRNKYVLVLI